MTQTVHNLFAKVSFVIFAALLMLNAKAQTAPELVFRNPVLKSGQANKQGALYRFSNVTTGVDAELKLKKFSRNDIVMQDVDLGSLGWDKALQPQFGLAGLVAPNQDWYIDFELSFFKAGTNNKQTMQKVDFTALDVDGDGWSISEYAMFENPTSIVYSTLSYLNSNPAGVAGQSLVCDDCNVASILVTCPSCNGTGKSGAGDCPHCDGSGLEYSFCHHGFGGVVGNILQGPIQNFANIDTNATQVMATYQYANKDKIKFRYGAKSGTLSSNGSGVRLNSLWGKSFSLAPWVTLPVKFTLFNAMLKKADAVLNWEAVRDEKLSHFVVQRSIDGKTYSDIAIVLAGESTAYAYKDNNVASNTGFVYYRVVGVDQTKETQTSVVKMIGLPKAGNSSVAIAAFPNPAVADLHVTLPATWQGKSVTFELYNAAGTLAKTVQATVASQTETITLNGVTKGVYVVKAACGGEAAAQRIVKN